MWFDPRSKMPVEDMDGTIRTPDGREFDTHYECNYGFHLPDSIAHEYLAQGKFAVRYWKPLTD